MWYNVGAVLINIVAGIYRTVARAYNLMLSFTVDTFSLTSNANLAAKINSIIDSIYTLIAVFMLFRITVTMIQYLVDPDKISDKSMGTGKLITRVIVSIALVIAFPIIMKNVVNPLQDALLQEDSILYKLFSVDDANAASADCINNINSATNAVNGGNASKIGVGELASGCSLDSSSFSAIDSKFDDLNLSGVKIYCNIGGEDESDESCDSYLGGNYYIKYGEYSTNKNGTQRKMVLYLTTSQTEANQYSDALDQGYSTSQINSGISENLSELLNSDGGKFAMDIAASFSTDPIEVTNTKFIADPDGVQRLATLVNENVIDYDTFISIICGIILVVIFLILCIEVVIRNLKLLVLQILAPIAFISYMNPNDKVLENWFKKFIGCYLDLFFKILAIRMSIFFVSLISSTIGGGLEKILIYLGIFLFAKTVPNLISDVLGIKNMGGTFKDSMNSLKTAAFTGAGAVAGAGVGLVSGMGKGASFGTVAGGLLGGAFRGASGGAKGGLGGITKGISTQKQNNISARGRNAEGGSFWGQTTSRLSNLFGQQDSFEAAEAKNKAATNAISGIKEYEEESSKSILKLAGLMKNEAGDYTNDSFGEYARATAELAAFNAGTYDGPLDANQLQANVKKTQKAAIADYTNMLRTGSTFTTREEEFTNDDGTKVKKKVNTRDYSKYLNDSKDDTEKNNYRLNKIDKLLSDVGEKSYDSKSKGNVEKIKESSATEMEANRANHIASGKN